MLEPEVPKSHRRSKPWIWIGIGAAGGLTICILISAVLVFNILSGFQKSTGDVDTWVRSLDWSPDGYRLVAGSADACITIWDTASGKQVGSYTGFPGFVRSVDWSPDGSMIATGDEGSGVNFWDPDTVTHVAAFRLGELTWVYRLVSRRETPCSCRGRKSHSDLGCDEQISGEIDG